MALQTGNNLQGPLSHYLHSVRRPILNLPNLPLPLPLVLVLVSVAGVVLTDPSTRQDFVDALTDALPLTEAGADSLDAVVRGVSGNAGTVGLASVLGLIWTASGMMAALRGGLDDLMGGSAPGRPYLQGKLIDLLMLLAAGVLLTASAAFTIADSVARSQVVDPLRTARFELSKRVLSQYGRPLL